MTREPGPVRATGRGDSPRRAAVLLALVFAGGLARAGDHRDSPRFISPDGRRVVRLYLLAAEPDLLGSGELDPQVREALAAMGPALEIEYSMLLGAKEVLVRSFTARVGVAGADSRYRVLWGASGERFLVLRNDTPSKTRSDQKGTPSWGRDETVVFFHDRSTGESPPVARYRPEDWDVPTVGPASGVTLPLVALSARDAPSFERLGVTGRITDRKRGPSASERIQNFTIHPNTQNLRTGETGLFAMPRVLDSAPSPDGRFTAKLAGDRTLMVLLEEGALYRDQIWVLVYPVRHDGRAVKPDGGLPYRLRWSTDSRHLLLTRGPGSAPALASSEESYLLLDVSAWSGVLYPTRSEVEGISFAGSAPPR